MPELFGTRYTRAELQRRYDLEIGALPGAAAIGEFETRVRAIR